MKAEYTVTLQENQKPYANTVPRQFPLLLVKETKRGNTTYGATGCDTQSMNQTTGVRQWSPERRSAK